MSEIFRIYNRERLQCRNLTKDFVSRDEVIHQLLIPQLKCYGQLQRVKGAKTEVESIAFDQSVCHRKL
jgi:hypothetical protein